VDDKKIRKNLFWLDDKHGWLIALEADNRADWLRLHTASLDETITPHRSNPLAEHIMPIDMEGYWFQFGPGKNQRHGAGAREVIRGKAQDSPLLAVRAEDAPQAQAAHVEAEPVSLATPAVGETLIGLFCSGNIREAILGDLAEKFEERASERGASYARAWYWWQVARSFGPFAWRWGRRLVALDDLRQLIGW